MTYPGNLSLDDEVRERILETYEHALRVAATGGVEEARLGCDFILRLDPLFAPAKTLASRLEGATGPVDLGDLARAEIDSGGGGFVAEVNSAAETDADADDAGLDDLESLDEDWGLDDDGTTSESLAVELSQLLADRSFAELAARAQSASAAIATDPSLQQIMAAAQERMEAAPYVENFLSQARAAVEGGDAVTAAGLVEKARALDASHPEIGNIQKLLVVEGAHRQDAEFGGEPPGLPSTSSLDSLESELPEWSPESGGDLAASSAEPSPGSVEPDSLEMDSPEMGSLEMDSLDEVSFGGVGFSLDEPEPGSAGPAVEATSTAGFAVSSPDEDTGPLSLGSLEEVALSDEDSLDDLEPLDEEIPSIEVDDLSLDGFEDLPELEPLEGEELDSAPSAALSGPSSGPSDSDPRIAELLDEGQSAFDDGEFQTAIDAWSRIFLIDIDHREAARRIDEARGQKAEEDRLVEEAFHEGTMSLESGDLAAAEASFRKVLELQPHHATAAEYIAKIEGGEGEELLPSDSLDDLPAVSAQPMEEEAFGAGEVEAPVARSRTRTAPPVVVPPAAPSKSRFLTIAGGVLLLLLIVSGVVWWKWGALFPNTEEPLQTAPVVEVTPLERATAQYADGKRAAAISQLKRLPPASPHYQEAQALITAWEAEAASEAGPSEEQLAERASLLETARELNEEQRYWESIPLLDRAAMISPLVDDEIEVRRSAAAMLDPFHDQIVLLRDAEYDRALRDLWVAREKDPTNPVVNHLLLSSYYNLGVRGLQQGRLDAAKENLTEAVRLAPEDEEIKRLVSFVTAYESREQDLLFRIYAKYLAPRPI